MSKNAGYLVLEKTDDFEQALAISHGPDKPKDGVLDWRGDEPAALFDAHKDARAAITRTEHYRKAFNVNLPEARSCKIVPATRVPSQKSEQ